MYICCKEALTGSASSMVRLRGWRWLALATLVMITSLSIAVLLFLKRASTPEDDLVPNIVHFIRFGPQNLTFIDAVCMLAALKNQKPRKLFVHTDRRGYHGGKYWDVVVKHPSAIGVVEVKYLPAPKSIMGKRINSNVLYYHGSDFERLKILLKYGGIYLDHDSYIVKNLKEFFKHETTLGWNGKDEIGNQVLIAKKNSRFLRLWRDSYEDYQSSRWYYNGGHLPARILRTVPETVHALTKLFAEYNPIVIRMLYYYDTGQWRDHYAIHLLINHQYMLRKDRLVLAGVSYPVVFNESNILKYPISLRQMALDVYPFDKATFQQFTEIYPHLPGSEDSHHAIRHRPASL